MTHVGRPSVLRLMGAITNCLMAVVVLIGCGADQSKSPESLPPQLKVFATYLAESSLLLDEFPADRDVESLQRLFTETRWEGVRAFFDTDAVDFRDTDDPITRIVKFRVDFEDAEHFEATVCTEEHFAYVRVSTGEPSFIVDEVGTKEVVLVKTDGGWLIDGFTAVSSACQL